MKFTQVPADAFERLQLNAGVLLTEFDPAVGTPDRSKIFGATSGGVSFNAAYEFTDFGEDVDNVPNNTKEMKVLKSVTATMSGTFLTLDTPTAKRLIGAADIKPDGRVLPRADLKASDFFDVWWVGDYSNVNTGKNAGYIAIRLIDALSSGGFQIQSGKDTKGTFSFEFTGHYSLADVSILPYEVYIQKGALPDVTLASLSFGALTLVPAFSPTVKAYVATTTDATNTITATPTDEEATVAIDNGGTPVASGSAATWAEGDNAVTITVTNDGETDVYTVTVTKED